MVSQKYEDYHKGLVARYMNKIFVEIAKICNRDGEKLILDFGGGYGHLSKFLVCNDVVVYDVVPELSQVEDYRQLKPNIIVCCHVLEHMSSEDIENTMREFIKMTPNKLIIALPTENIFSKIGVWITRLKSAYEDIPHLTTYKEVNKIVERYFKLVNRKYLVCKMTQLSIYENALG